MRLAKVFGRRQANATEHLILETEHNALLRLGALAGSAPIQELFDAMAEELGRIVDIETGETFQDMAGVSRFDADGQMTFVAGWGPRPGWPSPVGSRWPLDGDSVNARVFRTGRPARLEGGIPVTGSISRRLDTINAMSSVAVPIFVDDKLWGSATVVSDRPKPLPPTTESRLAEFAALASTAISSAQRREEVQRLADEHAALRQVATLVATGAEPEQVWKAVVAQLGELCGASRTGMVRYDSADSVSIVALWAADGEHEDFPDRWPLDGNSLSARVARERTVIRIEDWDHVEGEIGAAVRARMSVGSSIMAPVFAHGGLWGGLVVHSAKGERLAADTERRITGFAELVSAALANATARAEVRRLADEQATIRRVATLVARQAAPAVICRTVAEELAVLLGVEDVRIFRYGDGDDTGDTGDGDDTGEPARLARDAGPRSTIACPIFTGDRLWGVLTVASPQPGRLPERVLPPISDCADLIATALRNTEAEERLRASRERIVTATDQARRRFERDLHDGAQQRLVALALELRASEKLDGKELAEAADEVDSILTDLRDLSRGLHPAVLSEGGLPSAIRSLVRRCPTPVRLVLPDPWPSAGDLAEIACYYVVAEALTNVAKHAHARTVDLVLDLDATTVRVTVSDDGVGGAGTAGGSGLLGIADRVDALGGTLSVVSPPGEGTTLVARLPRARFTEGRE